jgi:para-nitrobenzyl esterase
MSLMRFLKSTIKWGALICGALPMLAFAADQVRTTAGIIEGAGAQPSNVRLFRGIPYAAPPIGLFRWKEPQPVKPWNGVREAKNFGPRCMQGNVFGDMIFRASEMSEDCLYLNVWTPAKKPSEKLPVLVYFYGGSFVAGDGSEPRYDGESLATAGIVTVTLNYRLGVFGFLSHAELSKETTYGGSGNYGLMDQAAALRWVRDNIAAFGGDPRRVTIAGESAGSVSVSAQMASPLSRNLIAGAIGESGAILSALPARSLAQNEEAGKQFAAAANANSLADLRFMPARQLLDLAGKFVAFRFSPAIDGYFMPKAPLDIYASGQQAHVPLLAGSNSEEAPAAALLAAEPPTVASYRNILRTQFGAVDEQVFRVYSAAGDGIPVLDAAQALASDRSIGYSTWKWIELATKTGGKPTFYYYYTHKRPLKRAEVGNAVPTSRPPPRGASHSAEIEYALGNLESNLVYAWTDEDRKVSEFMRAYFANFIKTGNPNGNGLPPWPLYSTGQRMVLDVAPQAESAAAATARGRVLEGLPPTLPGEKSRD